MSQEPIPLYKALNAPFYSTARSTGAIVNQAHELPKFVPGNAVLDKVYTRKNIYIYIWALLELAHS